MGMIRAEMAASTGLWVFRLFQRKFVRGVATVASFLDDVAAFAEGGANLLRNTEVFPVDTHPIPTKGVTALLKLL